MPLFEYNVRDANGKSINAKQEASDVNTLISELRQKGYVILNVKEAKAQAGQSAQKKGRARRIKIDDLVIFSRQMATMVEAGIPLVQTLDILADQTENATFRVAIKKIKEDVESGKSLSEGLSGHKKIFSHLFISMVKAGEQSGSLDEILDRLAVYLEKMSNLQKKIKSAMTYPVVVFAIALIITTLMLMFIIPKFADIFKSMNAPLPAPTAALINASDFVRANFLLVVGVFVGIIFLIRYLINTPKGRLLWDRLLLKMPIFGILLLKSSIAKFSRTLSTLVKSGVPILNALEIVGSTAGNKVVEGAVLECRNSIREGEGIAGPLEARNVFPPMVVRMIAIGEETGELEEMLSKIADFYETQVDTAVDGLSALLEPLIIAFLGIVIGGIVIAMFLPILTMTSAMKM